MQAHAVQSHNHAQNHHVEAHAEALLKQLKIHYECSEVGNMERFIDQHRDRLRYIPERKSWVTWDGCQYSFEGQSEVFNLAIETSKSIYDEARDCETEAGRKLLTQWAAGSRTDARINRMIAMAAKHPDMVTSITSFDTGKHELNCLNGVVDLKTSHVEPHSPRQRCLRVRPRSSL